MPNVQKTFKQADLERAMRAAKACALPVFRSEITKEGRIVLVHFDTTGTLATVANGDAPNEWDEYFECAMERTSQST